MIKRFAVAFAFAAGLMSTAAHADSVIFYDNFDEDTHGLNVVPTGWDVTDGTVDIIGKNSPYDFIPGHGRYIDLDGSTRDAGVLSQTFTGLADGTYTLSFYLAGNQRDTNTEAVTVDFGGVSQTYTPTEFQGFTQYSFTGVATGGSLTVSFHDASADSIGALLDRVQISSAVPEPGSLSLLLAGLAAVGIAARRRRRA